MKKLLLLLACVASLGMLYAQPYGQHHHHGPQSGNPYGNNYGQFGNPLPGYQGRVAGPMFASFQEFNALKQAILLENFDSHRLDIFRTAAGQRLFLAAQLKELAHLFDFDSYRYSFAKIALAHCYDLDNFYQMTYAFDFGRYGRDLDYYISQHIESYVYQAPACPVHPAPGYGYPAHYPPLPVYQPVPGYSGQVGAAYPMSDPEFNVLMEFVSRERFDHKRFKAMKAAIRGRGLSTGQVASLARLFDFDSHRLNFAKYAFDKVYDIDNYYQVASEFIFDSYKDQLLDYIG